MRQKIWTILITAVVLLGIISGFGLQAGQAQEPEQPQMQIENLLRNRTITVTGFGEARIQPDLAIIQVGVQSDAETAQEALDQSDTQMQAVIQALIDSGVASEDIQLMTVQLYPRYGEPAEPPGDPLQIIGYTAISLTEVRVRDVENLGAVLDNAAQAGANILYILRFAVEDISGSLDEAREEALNDARSRAEDLANLLGVQLGPVDNVTEFSPGPFPFGFGAAGGVAGAGTAARGLEQPQSPAIEPGEQSFFVTLQVTWSIVPSPYPYPGP